MTMTAAEFEKNLIAAGCTITQPIVFVPGSNKDAEVLPPTQFMLVFDTFKAQLSPLVRKRMEKANFTTFYMKTVVPEGYFKCDVPIAVSAGGHSLIDWAQINFTLKQLVDTAKVRMGLL